MIHKLLAGRLIDHVDVIELLRANQESLDWRYLSDWINRLGLNRDMSEAWEQANPGKPLPSH